MDFTKEITMNLLLTGLQRLIKQTELREENRGILYILAVDRIREASMMDFGELCKVGGPTVKYGGGYSRIQTQGYLPYLAQLCTAMPSMPEVNEQSEEGWHTAHRAGHSDNPDLHKIIAADGVILAHHDIKYVEQLFGKDDITGCIAMDRDAEISGAPPQRPFTFGNQVQIFENQAEKVCSPGWRRYWQLFSSHEEPKIL